jgi:hypothetical protein
MGHDLQGLWASAHRRLLGAGLIADDQSPVGPCQAAGTNDPVEKPGPAGESFRAAPSAQGLVAGTGIESCSVQMATLVKCTSSTEVNGCGVRGQRLRWCGQPEWPGGFRQRRGGARARRAATLAPRSLPWSTSHGYARPSPQPVPQDDGVGGLAAMCLRLGRRRRKVQVLTERTGPTIGQKQRHRVGATPRHVNPVHQLPVQVDACGWFSPSNLGSGRTVSKSSQSLSGSASPAGRHTPLPALRVSRRKPTAGETLMQVLQHALVQGG